MRPSLAALLLAACVSTPGCESAVGPFDPQLASFELAISGGLIGQSFSFRVDGDDRDVTGVHCTAHCDFTAGERIVRLTPDQFNDLALGLEAADVFGLSGSYDEPCCDHVMYELEYERGGRSARVSGSSLEIPEALSVAIGRIVPLGRGVVPALVRPDRALADLERDSYSLDEVDIVGYTLEAVVSYGGGCEEHLMDAVAFGGWMESSPVQVNMAITHHDADDPCDAYITSDRRFDLTPLVEAYNQAYPAGATEARTLIVRLWDPTTGSQTEHTLTFDF